MFGPPGRAYVYRSYGIHWCLNFVCAPAGHGAGVLIRALEPTTGHRARCASGAASMRSACSARGRGGSAQALGITHAHNGLRLDRRPFRVVPRGDDPMRVVHAGVRIGISKSVDLPWRFVLAGSPFLSKPMRVDAASGGRAIARSTSNGARVRDGR